MKCKFFNLFLFFLFFLHSIQGSYFRHLTIDDGLTVNTVYSIFQDSRGFLWFGTKYGLNYYDGIKIKELNYQKENLDLGHSISAFCEDENRQLWVGTNRGVFIYDLEYGVIKQFSLDKELYQLSEASILAIFCDKNGLVWISTTKHLYQYSPITNRCKEIKLKERSASCRNILEDQNGRIWLPTNNNGLFCFHQNGKVEQFLYVEGCSNPIVYEDSNANIWLGDNRNGLFLLNKESKQIVPIIKKEFKHKILNIRSILEAKKNLLYLATDYGIIEFNSKTFERSDIPASTDMNGLNDTYVYSLCKDKEGGVWIGTYFGGVNYESPTASNFKLYNNKNSQISAKVISKIIKDDHDNVWMGSDDKGLLYWDRKTNKITHYEVDLTKENSLTYNNIHALCYDEGKLYIGMYLGGLDVFDIATNCFKNYKPNKQNGMISPNIYAIYNDFYKNLWVGTTSGLSRFDRKTELFESVLDLKGANVSHICEDQENNLWVSTLNKGVYKYIRKQRKWKQYRGKNMSLKTTVACDDFGVIWIGSNQGLYRYDEKKDTIIKVETSLIKNNFINTILCYNGYLWITTNNGLFQYNSILGTEVEFNKDDGLQSNQFTPNSGVILGDGTLLIGGISGFNSFVPSSMKYQTEKPKTLLTNFTILNEKANVSKTFFEDFKSITYLKEMVLPYNFNFFELEFATMSYSGLSKNRYKYKLEGINNKWIETKKPEASYMNLPSGDYLFKIKSSNGDNVWNDEAVVFPIRVLPHPLLTPSFIVIYIVLVLCLIVFSIRRYLAKIKKKHDQTIEKIEQEKEAELYENKLTFFTHVVHEIRTPITLILLPLENIMAKQKENVTLIKELQLVKRNALRLLDLVNQLLDFRKIENDFQLDFQLLDVREEIEKIVVNFQQTAQIQNVDFQANLGTKVVLLNLNKEVFSKIITNLLSNAFKFTKDEIFIELIVNDEEVEILVSDNGIGLDETEKTEIFKPFYQVKNSKRSDSIGSGIGLSIIKKSVDLMGGMINVESEREEGASFCLTFPRVSSEDSEQLDVSTSEDKKEEQAKLLLVDDNVELLNLLSELFQDSFFVFTAKNGLEALDILRKKEISIIISDIMMPEMDGNELCCYLKEQLEFCHIPLILLTAKIDKENQIHSLESGADIYMEKPFSPELLKAQVKSLLQNRKMLLERVAVQPDSSLMLLAKNRKDQEFIEQLTQLIEDNILDSQINVERLALKFGLCRSNFYMKVKSISEMTPNEFIRLVRLKKAATMFQQGEETIKEVSLACGFSSPSYFSKCFQQQFGVTPKKYIKNLLN